MLIESGRLEFDEFVTLAAKFIVEEDAEALEKELREAFRLYDKEGECHNIIKKIRGKMKMKNKIYKKGDCYFPILFVMILELGQDDKAKQKFIICETTGNTKHRGGEIAYVSYMRGRE